MAERFPFDPLAAVIAGIEVNREPCGTSPGAIAQLLDVNERQVYRWRDIGLSMLQADRICVLIGRHPAEIWAAWTTDAEVAA